MFEKTIAYKAVDGTTHITIDEAGVHSVASLLGYTSSLHLVGHLLNDMKKLAKNKDVLDWLTDYIKKP